MEYGCIVVKPNCAAQSFMAIIDAFDGTGVNDITVSLMQAITGSGKNLNEVPEIQGNILPLPKEAEKNIIEPQKIFGNIKNSKIVPVNMNITATSYRVPVEDGHTANISFTTRIDPRITIESL
jgi:aspartate-semialdehyde dehydrogenase